MYGTTRVSRRRHKQACCQWGVAILVRTSTLALRAFAAGRTENVRSAPTQ